MESKRDEIKNGGVCGMRENGRKCEAREMPVYRINYALNDMIFCV